MCEDLCIVQAARSAILPDFKPIKYEKIYNKSSSELLNIAKDPVLSNNISEMCEKMFDIQINCSFESHNKILEPEEYDLLSFLLHTTRDIKQYLGWYAHAESVSLPSGYTDIVPVPVETQFSNSSQHFLSKIFKVSPFFVY